MIDLKEDHLEIVKAILKRHIPSAEVRAFGSRVTRTAKDWSDLDIAIVADGKLQFKTLALIKEAFEESDLPFRVDILDWNAISEEFRNIINGQFEVIQKSVNKVESSCETS